MHHGSRAKKKKASGRPSDDLQKLKGLKLYVRTYAKNIINLFTTSLETVQFQICEIWPTEKRNGSQTTYTPVPAHRRPPLSTVDYVFRHFAPFDYQAVRPCAPRRPLRPPSNGRGVHGGRCELLQRVGVHCTVNQTTARAPRRNLHWRSRGLPTATAISTPLLGGTKFSATGMAFLGSQAATATTARAAPSPWMRHGRCRLTNRASLASTGATLPT